ncbi:MULTISPECIES: type II toxin-antitoxin system RelE family toxin [Paenibacillus]|uniref:Plasmid stabilization protein n=1 Tax=Paenibacillus apis TaxID=1792174 RepID=A0A919Y175_9BACL|nr:MULTISPECIES: type II toxin-antitoxin system RelE/ParE family toxin [Paenibacillus]GIO42782.1 plasmid stabilization protein [Paenibacillus apis]
MNYEVKFLKDAYKNLQKQDSTTRNRILDHLKILSDDPRHPELDIKKMQGVENQYRLRVGSFRIVYSIIDKELIIIVIKLGSRGDIYKS